MDSLPNYLAVVRPVPKTNRVPWYLSSAQTYAGVMLWFVFWQVIAVGTGIDKDFVQYSANAGGVLSHGVVLALVSVVVAALICHFLFYLVPGLLGFKSGLPLYVVGTSTYGAYGGFLMPGFLMGLLQFGWLGVSSFFSAIFLCAPFGYGPGTFPHAAVAIVWAIAAAVVGLKGIRYVAGVNTFAPIVPLIALAILAFGTLGGVAKFDPQAAIDAGLKTTVSLKDVRHRTSCRPRRPRAVVVAGVLRHRGLRRRLLRHGGRRRSRFRHEQPQHPRCASRRAGGNCVGHDCVGRAFVVDRGRRTRLAHRPQSGRFAGNAYVYGRHRRQRLRRHDVAACTGGFPLLLLLLVDRGQQLQDHVAEDQPVDFGRHRHAGEHHVGRHRLGGRRDGRLHHHRRVVRTDLRRDGGRLPAGRLQMARPSRRFQSGGLDIVGGRVRGGRRRIGSRPKWHHPRHPLSAGGGVHRRIRALRRVGQGRRSNSDLENAAARTERVEAGAKGDGATVRRKGIRQDGKTCFRQPASVPTRTA